MSDHSPHPASSGNDVTRIVLLVLVLGMMIGGSFWILRPFLPPLVWSTMIVVATWPLMQHAERLLWRRRSLAVTVMTGAFLLLVVVPVVAAIASLADHMPALGEQIKNVSSLQIPAPPDWVARLPLVGGKLATEWQNVVNRGPEGLAAQLAPYAKAISTWVLEQAGTFGMVAVQLFVTIALTAVLYAYGEAAARAVLRFAGRLGGQRGVASVELAGQAIRAVALGIIVTAIAQTVLGGIGLVVAGVPYAGVLTALIFLFCIAQLGPPLVLLPAVAWLYWKDAHLAAVLLLIWTIGIGVLDNLLRPILIQRGADLPLLLIMAGVIGGLLAFGVLGLFVGPVVLAVTYTLLNAWVEGPAPPRADGTQHD